MSYEIKQVISEHKHKYRLKPVKRGKKRVEAIVNVGTKEQPLYATRHIDIDA